MKSIAVILILFFACATLSFAIDNPDAPDYVGEFEKKIAPLEKYITQDAKTTLDMDQGYTKLEKALDQELNVAYKLLISKLDPKEKESLKSSQIRWLKYRDAEFKWIIENWNNNKFGSSSAISRGQYRTTIIKERVLQLLNYLKNY